MMNKRIPNALLSKFSRFINQQMGIYFPKNRWLDLLRGICSAAREFGFDDVEECIHWLLSSPLKKNQVEILACHLTVGETYFFRETKIIEAMEQYVLPEIIKEQRQNGKRLRLWSAGCCTGEEPYTLAILLSRMIPDIKDWNITILATDINPLFLQKATVGIYREWSFRGTPYWIKDTYFRKLDDGNFEILPSIKRMVKFSYLNLVEDMYPSIFSDTNAMDVIFCRNVMMYFSPDIVKKIVAKLHDALLDDRWLIVGSSETSQFYFPQYITVNFPGAILYKKINKELKKGQRVENYIPNVFSEDKANSIRFLDSDIHFIPNPELETDVKIIEEEKEQWEVVEEKDHSLTPMEAIENLYQSGDYKGTIQKIEDNIGEYEKNPSVIKYLAKACANQGKLNEALYWCEKAIVLDKLNPQFYHLRAAILEEQGYIEKALGELKRALYLDPNFVLAHFMLGNLTRKQGNLQESKKYFENALSILKTHDREEILPESEGMNAGRLMELIQLSMNGELNA